MNKVKKFFIFVATFLLISNSNSYSEVVNKVIANGNDRISLETIAVFGDIKVGSNYDSSDINLLIKKLYLTNYFSNISIELKDGVLIIDVKENPVINLIEFNGEKAKKNIEALKKLLVLGEKNSFIENYVKKDINLIKDYYRNLGFYFIKIDAEIEKLSKNRVNILYSIDKGVKAKIAKIYFIGEKKIREKRLRDVITSQESKIWKVLSRNVYLSKSRVELDKRLLKNYYKNKGYYEVEVTSSTVEYAEGSGFILTYGINAGKRYRFKKISANVSDALDKEAFSSLQEEFDDVIGKYYSQSKLTSILNKIDKLSEQKELQFINHNVTETLTEDSVEVRINIFEGKKFIIERINIAGNNVTNDSVVRSMLIVDEGDPYSALLINKSINKLKARGIFSSITQKITEGSSPGYKNLDITVVEKATGEISAGFGVGTAGASLVFAVRENNWLGRGITLDTNASITEERISGMISLINPNYKYSGNMIYGSLRLASTDMRETSGYESNKTGFNLGKHFEQYENVSFSTGFSGTYEKVEVQSSASAALRKMDGTFANLDFDYAVVLDERNQSFQPTSGYKAKFSQSLPLIVDSSSLENTIDISSYHSFSEDIITSIRVYGKSIHGLNDEDVRVTRRLFLPQNRLRGFNVKKTGPKEGLDYIGGNYIAAAGIEAQLPKLLPESTKTDLSVFLDAANVWKVDYTDAVEDSNKIRSAIGVAANVYTVIGPLSFTLAKAITKGTNDETQTFSFRIGTSF